MNRRANPSFTAIAPICRMLSYDVPTRFVGRRLIGSLGSLAPKLRAQWRFGLVALALLASLAQFASAGMIYAKAWLAPLLIADAFSRSLASGDRVKPWPWADTHPVARLEVPRLAVERFVMDGDSGHAMAFGAGMAGGTRPGEPGMVMVAGHRDTHFRFLSGVQQGDEITLDYEGQEYRYRVFATVIADAKSGFIPTLMPAQGLLLVTCYPFDEVIPGGSQRYVVVGERIWPKALPLLSPPQRKIVD